MREKKTNLQYNSGPTSISQGALHSVPGNAFISDLPETVPINLENLQIVVDLPEELANGLVHPVTQETLTKYKKIIKVPELRETWLKAM